MNLVSSDAVKGFVDAGTTFIEILDSGIGNIMALSLALTGLRKVLKIGPMVKTVNGEFQIFGRTISTIKNDFALLSSQSTGIFGKMKAGFSAIFTGVGSGGIDLSKMLSEDAFNQKLNGLIVGFNNIDQSIKSVSWDDYVQGVSASDQAMGAALKTCKKQNGTIVAGAGAYQAYTGATASAAIGTSTVGEAAKFATAKLIAMKVAALAANMALTMGLSALISFAMQGISAIVNAEKKVIETANEAATASQKIREQNKSLDDYKNKIQELRKTLEEDTLSEQEAYNAREELLNIQNDLIENYGLEKDKINLVTGAIKDQIAAIDELSKKNAQTWINNNQKSINNAIDFFNDPNGGSSLDGFLEGGKTTITNWGSTKNVSKMIEEYAKNRSNINTFTVGPLGQDIKFTGSIEEVKQEVEDFQDWLNTKEKELSKEKSNLLSIPISDQTDDIKKQIKSIEKDISQLQDVREDIGTEYANWFGEDSSYATNKKVIEETQYNTALTQYTNQYMKILQAKNDLTEAQAKGDKEGIKKALDSLNTETMAAAVTAKANGQSYMVNFFDGIRDEYANMSKEMQFEIDLSENIELGDTGKKIKDALKEALSGLKGMNAEEILQLGEIDPNNSSFVLLTQIADQYEMKIEDLCNALVNLKYIQSGFSQDTDYVATTVTSLEKLTSSVDSYKSALETVNSIISDGEIISEDYYNTLKEQLDDITVSEQGFSDAIEKQNGQYVVKNISLLQKLVNQSRKAQKATIQVAKAQAQLQYKNLTSQLKNNVNSLLSDYKATKFVSSATLENIHILQGQIDTLKETIRQYSLLEVQMSGMTDGYEAFNKAKEQDEQYDQYGSTMIEALKVIDNGLLEARLGTASVSAAIKAFIPEEALANAKTLKEEVAAIHDYIDGDKAFSDYFTVDDDGNFSIEAENVTAFIKDMQKAGILTGENEESFGVSAEYAGELNKAYADFNKSLKESGESAGITKEAFVAMLTEASQFSYGEKDILIDITTPKLEQNVMEATSGVEKVTDKIAKFWEEANASGKFDATVYKQLQEELAAAEAKLNESEAAANKNAQQYNLCQAALKSYNGELKMSEEEANALAIALHLVDTNGNPTISVNEDGTLQLTDQQLAIIGQKLANLEEPTVMRMQLRYDEITAQIDTLQQYIDGELKDPEKNEILMSLGIKNTEEAQKKIDELKPEQNEIGITYGITETSSEQEKSVLESYQELAKNGLEFEVTTDVTDAMKKIKEIDENNPKDKEVIFTADGSTASSVIKGIADQIAALPDDVSITIETKEKKTIFETVTQLFSGNKSSSNSSSSSNTNRKFGNTIYAKGSDGLKANEHNAIVGELGEELVCDTQKGVYYTVGTNGTEMVDLPRGAIIYNHKQTEELLKNGKTSRGTLTGGLSFAKGNAHAYDEGIITTYRGEGVSTSFKDGNAIKTAAEIAAEAAKIAADASDSLSDSADSISDAVEEFEDTIDWIEVLFTRIDNILAEQEAIFANMIDSTGGIKAKESLLNSTYEQMYNKANASLEASNWWANKAAELMSALPPDIQNKIKNGTIDVQEFKFEKSTEGLSDEAAKAVEKEREAYEEYVNQINEAIDAYNKISEYKQQYYNTVEEIANKAVEHQEEVANAYENEIGLVDRLNDHIEARNDLLATKEGFASESYYKAQISNQEKMLAMYQAERKELQRILDQEVALGHIQIGSQQWFDMKNAIYDVDDAIIDTEASIEDLQNSINDLKWDKFDELINRFEYLEDEIGNIVQLLSHDPNGLIMEELRDLTTTNWATDSGLATIGLYAQEMERAQYVANKYADAIQDLKRDYASGRYNETEYLSKLNELISAQYENIQNYFDARDAIVELNEARVDAIKTGIQEEIDAYDELIQKKKDLLNREQD